MRFDKLDLFTPKDMATDAVRVSHIYHAKRDVLLTIYCTGKPRPISSCLT